MSSVVVYRVKRLELCSKLVIVFTVAFEFLKISFEALISITSRHKAATNTYLATMIRDKPFLNAKDSVIFLMKTNNVFYL